MDWPLLSLLPIGMAAAVSPCPLTTNIAAVGFISRGIGSRHQSAVASLLYTLGRVSAYVLIGWLISRGLSSAPALSFWMQEELPVYLAPVMMVTGLVILGFVPFFSLGKKPGESTAQCLMAKGGVWGAFALGFLFALALCPPFGGAVFRNGCPPVHAGREQWFLVGHFPVRHRNGPSRGGICLTVDIQCGESRGCRAPHAQNPANYEICDGMVFSAAWRVLAVQADSSRLIFYSSPFL